MIRVIGIRFQEDGKMILYDAGELAPQIGDYVIAETSKGIDLAEVIMGVREMEESSLLVPVMKIVRIATGQDIQRATENRTLEQDAFRICNQKILEHRLEMKLVSVEALFDNSKILFYFTANGRVDFRALVKDLASIFRTRIELRQIGVRDEARMLGGLGPCGRPICCRAFLNDFQPVSIRMAKDQSLSLNPTKISGVCGRLMCCLKYEQDQYEQVRKRMPRTGKEVVTPDGIGTVADLNVIKETVSVRISSGDTTEIREYPMDQVSRPEAGVSAASRNAAPAQQKAEEAERSEQAPERSEENVNPEHGAEDVLLPEGMDEEELIAQYGDLKERTKIRKPRQAQGSSRFGPRPPKQKPAGNEENGGNRKNRGARPNPPKKEEKARQPKEQKYGQPVKRENPKRGEGSGQTQAQRNEAGTQPAQRNGQNRTGEKKTEGSKGRNWADAVEKALQATDA